MMLDLCNPCALDTTTVNLGEDHRRSLSLKSTVGFGWDDALCGFDLSDPWSSLRDDEDTPEKGETVLSMDVDYGSSSDDDEDMEHHIGYGGHAALHYEDIEQAGPPAPPVEFPTPFLQPAERTAVHALDHRTLEIRLVKFVLMPTTRTMSADGPDRCYMLKKKTSRSPMYGTSYMSVVLKRRDPDNDSCDMEERLDNERKAEDCDNVPLGQVEWESTDELVSVTVAPFKRTWQAPSRVSKKETQQSTKGPLRACAAMQHVGNYHPHILGCLEVLQDDQNLYTVTKLQTGVDLQTRILTGRDKGATYYPCEANARPLFHQLLQGLFHLQKKGVYHSELSLETIFMDAQSKLVITNFGSAVRVPYNDPSNLGCIVGETEGTTRRLLRLGRLSQQHPPENIMYLAPEVLEHEPAIDGFAADIWSAGVILFILLVGMAPFKSAHYWDDAYAEISGGRLKQILMQLNIRLSDEATSLMQNMFWRDPRERLTLAQIMDHAWTKGERFPPPQPSSLKVTKLPKSQSVGSRLGALAPSEASTVSSSALSAPQSSSSIKRISFTKALSSLFSSTTSTCTGESPNSSSKSVLSSSSKSALWACGSSSSKRRSTTNVSSNSTVASNTTSGAGSVTNAHTTASTRRKSIPKKLKPNMQMLALPNL